MNPQYIEGLPNSPITLTGDATGTGANTIPVTLATVNANVGTFQGLTVNAKGQVTAAANQGYGTGSVTSVATGSGLTGGTITTTGTISMANMAANSIKGNNTGASAAPIDLTVAQATTLLGLGTISTQNANAVAITGGTINGATIGATTASAGAFTTLSASGTVSGAGFTTLLAPYAPLASPTFTGTPSLPTGTTGVTQPATTNNTSLATTAYVQSQYPIGVAHGGTGQTSYTNGQLLIGNTTGNTLAAGTLTPGTGIAVANGAGSISVSLASKATRVAGVGAPVGISTPLATWRQMGLNVTFTPTTTGTIVIIISGNMGNSVSGGQCYVWGSYGTGTPPANGAATSGTSFTNYMAYQATSANSTAPFSTQHIVTGAALGTALWIDLWQQVQVSGTAFATQVVVTAIEV